MHLLSWSINKSIIWNLLEDFNNNRSFSEPYSVSPKTSLQHFQTHGPEIILSNNLQNTIPTNTYYKDSLICIKTQAQFFRSITELQLWPGSLDKWTIAQTCTPKNGGNICILLIVLKPLPLKPVLLLES